MRLEVSWIWLRMPFMPRMVFSTAPAPLRAASSERLATWADCRARSEESVIDCAMRWTVVPASSISRDWRSVASSSSREVRCADSVAVVTRVAASLMRRTSTDSSSTV